MKAFEKELYNIANRIVGHIGPSTNHGFSETNEPYITFALKTKNVVEIRTAWTEWIRAYVSFQQLAKPEGERFEREPQLTIFWRTHPKVRKHEKELCVYARLLISRLDFNASTIDNNI